LDFFSWKGLFLWHPEKIPGKGLSELQLQTRVNTPGAVTRVKLAVISPSRHFRDLAKKTPK